MQLVECEKKIRLAKIICHSGYCSRAEAEKIIKMNPDGVFLSNGPGDPAAVNYAINTVKKLIGIKPIFGICLGHQILALALGAKTFKLKYKTKTKLKIILAIE